MKFTLLLVVILALSGTPICSQIIELKEFETTSVEILGRMGENTAITISLRKHTVSYFDSETYSVEGWYWYDKYQKKIPVVGIYSSDLTLFTSTSAGFKDSILGFKTEADSPFEIMEDLLSLTNYQEKFSLSDSNGEITGTWTNGKKELGVFCFAGELDFVKQHTFLATIEKTGDHYISLKDIGIEESNLELVSRKGSTSEIQVILSYDSPSSGFINGRCGGGREKGFILLKFDRKFLLLQKQVFEIESCNGSIWGEENPPKPAEVMTFHVFYSDDTEVDIVLDKTNCTIVKK